MNLLKKIFNKKPVENSEKAPVLNVASQKRQQQMDRVRLLPLHRISFCEKNTGKNFELANISHGGLGLLHGGDSSLTSARVLQGVLTIDKESFVISGELRHCGEFVAGFQIDVDEPAQKRGLLRAIESYLRLEIMALQLRPVNSALIQKDPRGEAHWFTDGRQNEIFCISDREGLVAFHMNFLGKYIEGERDGQIRTGDLSEGKNPSVSGRHSAALLKDARSLPEYELQLAQSFVNNVIQSPIELRDHLLKFLSDASA
jgi:hypothetical protein